MKLAALKVRMLSALADPRVFTIRAAAELADISFSSHYVWVKEDPIYNLAVEQAFEKMTQHLEQKANERSVGVGVKTPSDYLMTFLLSAKRPAIYRQSMKGAIEGDGKTISFTLSLGDAGGAS